MAMLLQKVETPFDTELFKPVMDKLKELEKVDDIKSRRIVAEHLRSSIMIICDGGRPSNIDRGYVLRRLIRRMTRHLSKLQIDLAQLGNLIDLTIDNLNEMYPELKEKKEIIKTVIIEEKDKFIKTLGHGEKEFEKVIAKLKQENKKIIDGQTIFKLYETYGFPPEITADLAREQGFEIDTTEFDTLFKQHQEKSRLGSEQKFKGGLADGQTIGLDATLASFRKVLEKEYLGEIDDNELIEGAIKGYIAGLNDPYTEYYTKEEMKKLMDTTNGNYVGIGIYMLLDKEKNAIVIIKPMEGSPAEKAGLLPGDVISKVDGEPYTLETITAISDKIRQTQKHL